MKEKFFTIPNILSIFRILLIPFIIWSYFLGRNIMLIVLIVVSAASDIIDGFIARRFNMVTSVGKALDPIADKLTLLTLLCLMCHYLKSTPIMVLLSIFVVKEFIMGVEGLIVIKKTGTTYSANIIGKLTTVVLYLTVLMLIIWQRIPKLAPNIAIGVCIVFVCISLGVYTYQNIRRIKSVSKNEN